MEGDPQENFPRWNVCLCLQQQQHTSHIVSLRQGLSREKETKRERKRKERERVWSDAWQWLVRFPNPLATGHSWQLRNLTRQWHAKQQKLIFHFKTNAMVVIHHLQYQVGVTSPSKMSVWPLTTEPGKKERRLPFKDNDNKHAATDSLHPFF